MYLDSSLALDAATTITGVSAAVNSATPIDQGVAGISRAYPSMGFAIARTNTVIAGTSLQIQFVSSAAAALTAPVIHYDSGTVALANLPGAGAINYELCKIPLPMNALRYMGFIYTPVNLTTGKVDAYVVADARFPEYTNSVGQ